MSDEVEQRVYEISHRGRLVTAEPWFEDGAPVVVDSHGAGELADGDLALLRVPRRGRAQLVTLIGSSSKLECVLDALLLERGARWVQEETMPTAAAVEPTDHPGRVDLRDLTTVTIDPDEARDFDDAISASESASGWRVWVHIADVSAYVRPGTALDRWARARAFSTYVPGQVSPMLPEGLSAGACSLLPERDRWCVTVEVALDTDAVPIDATMYRSVIRSDARLTYGDAERIVLTSVLSRDDAVAALVSLAATVAERLRGRRFARGAMNLARPELAIQLDHDGGIGSASWEAEPTAHALIEELMILANESVAAFLKKTRAEVLYRVHPQPDPMAILGLIDRLAALDVPTPARPENLTERGAALLVSQIAERVSTYARTPASAEALTSLVLRSLGRASYQPTNRGHAGLASSAYCHFTSPIRRYPDIVVHRALLGQLGLDDPVEDSDLDELGRHCSERERELAAVEHRANDICLAWLLDRLLYAEGWETVFEGRVIGVISSGLFVRFGDVFEGYLPARALPGDYFELDEFGVSLVGRRSARTFGLGAVVAVQVDALARTDGRIRLALSEQPDG